MDYFETLRNNRRMDHLEQMMDWYSVQANDCLEDRNGSDDDGYAYNMGQWSKLNKEYKHLDAQTNWGVLENMLEGIE